MENKNSNVKFIPPKSFVHLDFWFKFADVKLNVDKLSDAPRHLFASINSTSSTQPVIEIDCTGFNSQPTDKMGMFPCHGILINKNTKEEFINTNKSKLLTDVSNHYYAQLFSKKTLENSSELVFFILFSFADLKTHKYLYWFAFPVFRDVFFKKGQTYTLLSSKFQRDKLFSFELQFKMFLEKSNELFFVYNSKESRFYRLSEIINHEDLSKNLKSVDLNYTFFCCTDLCFDKDPSWLLRQFLGYIAMSCPQITQKTINCICLKNNVASSIVFTLEIQSTDLNLEKPLWVGWETNNGRLIPRSVDMSKIMDPLKMVEKSINLNLTLMKWRLVPNLNLDIISTTKYLLLGAGTLGCGVARSLLAWGAQHITFVDYGNVSLSNPVRQNLYLYEDAIHRKPKAATAGERLRQIHPNIISSGYNIKIPMPGHPVGKLQEVETNSSINQLKELVKQHDVIFLLTDSRESRWLPTLLGAFYKKMVITVALGFDTFLVIRHGSKSENRVKPNLIKGFKEIPGTYLGCYFCNDIVAPGNSMKDRTLDQQCTVTRPAVSYIASSLAVELTISLLQHKHRMYSKSLTMRKIPLYMKFLNLRKFWKK
uniref:Ubiquitin-like modifier-activating enzyme ATG7 n=4 Tax=Culex pipiens TaxID=7175 RepID=A0A8D8JSZ3_CULPI